MHFSPSFKTSQRCQPSPDGSFVASLTFQSPSAAIVTIRTTESLQTLSVIKITQESTNPASGLAWSPRSSRVLVYTSDQIRVYNVEDASLHSVIRNPGAGANKPTHVQFGATDDEVIAFSAFGLKMSIFNITTSKAVEIANPKFHHAASTSRGFCFGPKAHIAILTRSSGRDMLSIHQPQTREVVRSWFPETLDAAGLVWTPDGQWLLTWESPAHGHRLLVYSPDGQLVRTLDSSRLGLTADASLHPGLRICQVSDDGSRCALGDYSRAVTVLDTQTWRVELSLVHPLNVTPHDTLQIWQEQIGKAADGFPSHEFMRATQTLSPESKTSTAAKSASDLRTGCTSIAFDTSSNLLATRLEESPFTLWIWDIASAELRAVLMFHSSISFKWHPQIRELLLITCQDEEFRGSSYIWDPLSNGPRHLSLAQQLPGGKVEGKTQSSWVNWEQDVPILFLSDANRYLLTVATDTVPYPEAWPQTEDASSLQGSLSRVEMPLLEEDDHSTLEDTFSFKHG